MCLWRPQGAGIRGHPRPSGVPAGAPPHRLRPAPRTLKMKPRRSGAAPGKYRKGARGKAGPAEPEVQTLSTPAALRGLREYPGNWLHLGSSFFFLFSFSFLPSFSFLFFSFFLPFLSSFLSGFIYLFIYERDRERGRDADRVRSRHHAGRPTQDSIPGLQDHVLAEGSAKPLSCQGCPLAHLSEDVHMACSCRMEEVVQSWPACSLMLSYTSWPTTHARCPLAPMCHPVGTGTGGRCHSLATPVEKHQLFLSLIRASYVSPASLKLGGHLVSRGTE